MIEESIIRGFISMLLSQSDAGIFVATSNVYFKKKLLVQIVHNSGIFEQYDEEGAIIGIKLNKIKNKPEFIQMIVNKICMKKSIDWKILYISDITYKEYKDEVQGTLKSRILEVRNDESVVALLATNRNVSSEERNEAYAVWQHSTKESRVCLYDYIPFLFLEKEEMFDDSSVEEFAEYQFNHMESFDRIYEVQVRSE